MKQAGKYCLLIIAFLLALDNSAKASHIYGADLRYTHISGDLYNIVLTFYGDCSGETFRRLPGSEPEIQIFNGFSFVENIYLVEDVSKRENVTPVCAAFREKTVCDDPNSTLPGATRFIFQKTVSLPASADWRLVFGGIIDTADGRNPHRAGRSGNITNIQNVGSQVILLETKLNNLNAHNSSPEYNSIPTPYYCINVPQKYNLGAVDADKDSLTSELIPALLDNGGFVQYANSYSATAPLAAANGTFSYNNMSGQLEFTPNITQRSLVVIRVNEYKNGVLIGSSMREMTFVVLPDCNNKPPGGKVDSSTIVGGGLNKDEINVCLEEPILKLNVQVVDSDGNNINAVINDLPPGALAKIANNNTPNPIISLTWNTQNIPEGAYNMYVTYTDDACPLANSQTVTYTIRIVRPSNISHEVLKPTGCVYKQHIGFTLTDGTTPRNVVITNRNTGAVLYTYIDTTGNIVDSFKTGKYKMIAESSGLKCKSEHDFDVVDSGPYPIPVIFSDINTCLNAPVEPINVKPGQNATLRWYNMEGSLMDTTPVYTTETTGKYQWLVTQVFDTCETTPDTFTVAVNELPSIKVLNTNERLCNGDTVQLKAEGGIKYNWEPGNWIKQNDTFALAWVRKPTNYVVTGYNEYNCADKDSILMDKLDQCCHFFYPDAFSPNGDGLNDKWLPVTPANTDFYHLAIYNRWGQRIFESTDPNQKWDGSFKGRPCDIGTYNFFIQAKCVMGRQEAAQGTILLVR